MKRKILAGLLGLFLIIRLFPAVSIFWTEHISIPVLNVLAVMSSAFPFAVLEWLLGTVCLILVLSILRRNFFRVLSGIGLSLLAISLTVWYPLYFLPQPVYTADANEVSRLCEALIDELNAYDDQYRIPSPLPARFIRFPQWMDALQISGLCSFMTGEALISPDLEPISQPFVAVHERMHLLGYAQEGAANIAAWEDCIRRGGAYAHSARIWALRYGMGILRRDAASLYEENMMRMNHETLQFYRQAGGAYSPAPLPVFLHRLYRALGVENAMKDYEILVPYLAAGLEE